MIKYRVDFILCEIKGLEVEEICESYYYNNRNIVSFDTRFKWRDNFEEAKFLLLNYLAQKASILAKKMEEISKQDEPSTL